MRSDSKYTESLLEQLAAGKKEAIEKIYHAYFPGLLSFVRNNRGDIEDAKDLFQECLYYLYRYLRKSDAQEIANLEAYFRVMYRNRWYEHLKKRNREVESIEDSEVIIEEEDIHYYVYLQAFEKLGSDCKKVLRFYIDGKSSQEIADLLNTSIDYAKRKKYLCKESLKEIASQILKNHLTK
ncbi:MAG: RNA polymerase sigma factor [Saprospiraceae bacterium]|nr:RNA polymerase sigma factor [Saprospiraceae bacterium]